MNNEQLAHEVLNYQSLKREVEGYDLQQKMLNRMAYFCQFVFAIIFSFTIYGYWYFRSKSVDLKRKADLAEKAKINLGQSLVFSENKLKQEGQELFTKYTNLEESINRIVMKVRSNPKNFSDNENKMLFFWEQFQEDKRHRRLKEYDELMFYKSMINLHEQVK